MKTKIKKVAKKRTYKKTKNMDEEIKEGETTSPAPETTSEPTPEATLEPTPEPTPEPVVETPSTTVVKINSFDGDFGRADINLLRDKVNEIIDFINKQ